MSPNLVELAYNDLCYSEHMVVWILCLILCLIVNFSNRCFFSVSDFTRPLPPLSPQEIIPFSFKKGLSVPFNKDFGRVDSFHSDKNSIEMTANDFDPHRSHLSTMAVHLPNDTLDRSRNKVVLLQTDSGIHSDSNSNEGDNSRDCMVWD